MGSVYVRGDNLWLRFKAASGKWTGKASGLKVGQEQKAEAMLRKVESKIAARVAAGETEETGPLTVKRYADDWIKRRTNHSVQDDEIRLRLHALPTLQHLLLAEVRPRHVRELVRSLVAAGELAPRSVRNVYGTLHTMFHDAQVEELIDANPCVLKRGDLPKKIDKDPSWRPTAIFVREEIEKLISDGRAPEDRRVLYAVLALAGLRFGEAAALKWSSYDAVLEPLGKLVVSGSYSVKAKEVKAVKTERPREVPVHPTLAKILADWKLEGWPALMGRSPTSDDLLIPSREGRNRSVNHALKKFYEDCDRLGLRRRRQHDLRRTFITLARTDGARKDVLEVVTHGARGDIVDLYSSLPWSLLCEEVEKLKIKKLSGQLLAMGLPVAVAEEPAPSTGGPEKFATVLATVDFEGVPQTYKRPGIIADSGPNRVAGWTGLESVLGA